MAHINLLPWREQLRQKQKQNYIAMLMGVALSALFVMYLIGTLIDTLTDNQNARNHFLEQKIVVLDAQIKQITEIKASKKAIEQRMALIEQLQTSRNLAPIILDELAKIVPTGITFNKLKRTENAMEILGSSDSNNRLADFMRRLDQSEVFVDGVLSSIVADTTASNAHSEFKLTFALSEKVAPKFAELSEGAKK